MTYLGFVVDSVAGKLFLTEKRVSKILGLLESTIADLVGGRGITARQLAWVLGSLTAAAPALEAVKFAKPLRSPLLWFRPRWAWDYLVVPPDLTVATLTFLWSAVSRNPGRLYLRPTDIQLLATDASKLTDYTGWGVVVDSRNGMVTMGARFEDKNVTLSIAVLELQAFLKAIPLVLENGLLKEGHPLQPLIDNTVALSCVKKGSSTNPLLDKLAVAATHLLHRYNMELYSPLYVPSAINLADLPSWLTDTGVWMTQPWVRTLLLQTAPVSVDLFACNLSTVVPHFYSGVLCPNMAGVDAFVKTWPENSLLVPPLTLLSRAVAKLVDSNVHALLIVPRASCPWFHALCRGAAWLILLGSTEETLMEPKTSVTELSSSFYRRWVMIRFCPILYKTCWNPLPADNTSPFVRRSTSGATSKAIAASQQRIRCCGSSANIS